MRQIQKEGTLKTRCKVTKTTKWKIHYIVNHVTMSGIKMIVTMINAHDAATFFGNSHSMRHLKQ